MKIALAGPVGVTDVAEWLDNDLSTAAPLTDHGAAPVRVLARELLRRGHDLVLVTLDTGADRELIFEGPHLRMSVQPLRFGGRGRDAFRDERRMVEHVLRRESPDIVHAHWSYEYALGAQASGFPTVVTAHDWAPTILRWMPDAYRFVRLLMFVRSMSRAPHITTVSPVMAARIRRWRAMPVHIIPNALEDDAFDLSARTLQVTSPRLVSANEYFTPYKNVGRLLEAFRLVRQQIPEARLVLLGTDHEPGGKAEQWAAARDLSDGIEFRGQVTHHEVRRALREADVLVHPSLEESFGMVLIEAMAQGTPVIGGADSGAVPWVLGNGVAGELTDVRAPQAIATSVVNVLSDADDWSRRSQSAAQYAWANYRAGAVADSYIEVYGKVFGSVSDRSSPDTVR